MNAPREDARGLGPAPGSPQGPPPVPPPADPPPAAGGGRFLSPRMVIGMFVVGLGLVLFLGEIGYRLDPVLRWWPVALVALGAIKVTQRQGRGFGVLLIVGGAVLLLDSLDVLEVDDWDVLWPLAIIAVGGLLVWGALSGARRRAAAGVDDAATFNAAAVMGGVRRQITSRAFVGGEATAVMGGVEIDLRRAEMAGEQAEIEVFALWGGIAIAVPDHWRVELRGLPLLGAFEDTTRPRTDDAGRLLVISGIALMGGVEVKSELG